MLKRRRRQFFLHGEDGDRAGWISVNGCTECQPSIKGSSFLIHSQSTTRNLNSSLLSLSLKSVQVTKHELSHLPRSRCPFRQQKAESGRQVAQTMTPSRNPPLFSSLSGQATRAASQS